MDFGLKGRTAVVTAASSGLGREIAKTLAMEGANLLLFARTEVKLQDAVKEFSQFGVKVDYVAGDMRLRPDVDRLTAAAHAAGGADILVVNTGRPPQPMMEVLDEKDEQKWREGYEVQLWGAIQILSALVPPMIERGYGRVVAVTSATVKQPMIKHGLSTVFRAGLAGYLKHLANETAHAGVTVNSVCPALILTDGLRSSYNIEARAAAIPMKRGGKPEELAATVAFFCSTQSGFTTGASLQVDGGQVASLT
jgi:3-oxoacyl-[acyl-carrier protein] reductase